MVKNNEKVTKSFLPLTKALCAKVTETPEDSKITVFRKGNSQISNTAIPKGGQIQPIVTAGFNAIWKYAQKNPKKNITSEDINNAKANNIFFWTAFVCWPSNVASVIISLNQQVKTNPKQKRVQKIKGKTP